VDEASHNCSGALRTLRFSTHFAAYTWSRTQERKEDAKGAKTGNSVMQYKSATQRKLSRDI
jgi:hypothetical protein